jgi:hypothetical protein
MCRKRGILPAAAEDAAAVPPAPAAAADAAGVSLQSWVRVYMYVLGLIRCSLRCLRLRWRLKISRHKLRPVPSSRWPQLWQPVGTAFATGARALAHPLPCLQTCQVRDLLYMPQHRDILREWGTFVLNQTIT